MRGIRVTRTMIKQKNEGDRVGWFLQDLIIGPTAVGQHLGNFSKSRSGFGQVWTILKKYSFESEQQAPFGKDHADERSENASKKSVLQRI